jgi:Gly-Xaa carboxypeptidase
MAIRALSLLAAANAVSALVSSPILGNLQQQQHPLSWPSAASTSDFKCELPPVLDPQSDKLPSGKSLFSTKQALNKQVARHQAVVRVPSICYDDLGSFEEDKRWKPFYKLHDVLAESYPEV